MKVTSNQLLMILTVQLILNEVEAKFVVDRTSTVLQLRKPGIYER